MTKARIVVVEDEGLVALQIKEGLISAGYEVPAIAASGNEAMKIVADTEPDLVLMDIHLKGSLDGIQTADKIKEIYDIPVIYLTAYSDDDTVKRAKDTEPYGYILKPVSERSLELAIEMTLQKAKKEKQLKSDASWYSTIINGIGQGIIVISLKGLIKFLNPYAEKILRVTQEHSINRIYMQIFSLLQLDTKEPVEIPFEDIFMENKVTEEHTCILRSQNTTEVPIKYTFIPLQNQNRNTIGIIILFTCVGEKVTETETAEVVEEKAPEAKISMFPQNGQLISGIRVQWYRKPEQNTTGDSFNVFSLGHEHVGFYIFDVSCYGLTSALFSHNLNQFLFPDPGMGGIILKEEDGKKVIVPPLEVVRELNKKFFFEEQDNPYFTIVYGIINTRSGETSIVRAGHPYPIYQDNSGKTTLIKSEGGAVGMFAGFQADEYQFELKPGNRLFLYSEGLIDSSFADMNQESFNRLITFIEENSESTLENMMMNIKNEENTWHGKSSGSAEIVFVVMQRE